MKRPKPGKSADPGQPRDFYGYAPNLLRRHWPGNGCGKPGLGVSG